MGISEFIDKAFNPYERKARLWPAFLAGLPVVSILVLMYAPQAALAQQAVVLAASCGGLYLLANICRHLGKILEPRLYEIWGGKPSTQLLRHRDSTIERVTKLRYHSYLASQIKIPFPDAGFETRDPQAADEVYQSGVRWLLNQTRDTKDFGLLFQENVAYGFRRNALGIKPLALALAAASLTWVLMVEHVIARNHPYFFDLSALLAVKAPALLCIAISVVMTATWTLFFSKAGSGQQLLPTQKHYYAPVMYSLPGCLMTSIPGIWQWPSTS